MALATQVMPMLSVADMARSVRFYRDGLGGVEAYRFPPEGEPAFLTLRFGESEIGLGPVSDNPIHGQPQRPAHGHRIELCVYVEDVDTAVAELAGDGAEILAAPQDQPWGERAAFLADPDGNIVMLVAPLG